MRVVSKEDIIWKLAGNFMNLNQSNYVIIEIQSEGFVKNKKKREVELLKTKIKTRDLFNSLKMGLILKQNKSYNYNERKGYQNLGRHVQMSELDQKFNEELDKKKELVAICECLINNPLEVKSVKKLKEKVVSDVVIINSKKNNSLPLKLNNGTNVHFRTQRKIMVRNKSVIRIKYLIVSKKFFGLE